MGTAVQADYCPYKYGRRVSPHVRAHMHSHPLYVCVCVVVCLVLAAARSRIRIAPTRMTHRLVPTTLASAMGETAGASRPPSTKRLQGMFSKLLRNAAQRTDGLWVRSFTASNAAVGCYTVECMSPTLLHVLVQRHGQQEPIRVSCTSGADRVAVPGFQGELTCIDPHRYCGKHYQIDPAASSSAGELVWAESAVHVASDITGEGTARPCGCSLLLC